ncbi:hypothetical protein D3C87_1876600 [compost metagenome]
MHFDNSRDRLSITGWMLLSTLPMMRGISARLRTRTFSSASETVPRARPAPMARAASTDSWQVKALVEATPISGPAMIGKIASDSRAMVDSLTLTTAPIFSHWSLQ